MHKLTGRLADFVPFSACALFLRDMDQARVSCRFAAGSGAMLVETVTNDLGFGLAGRVVEQETGLMNEQPVIGLDFFDYDAKTSRTNIFAMRLAVSSGMRKPNSMRRISATGTVSLP